VPQSPRGALGGLTPTDRGSGLAVGQTACIGMSACGQAGPVTAVWTLRSDAFPRGSSPELRPCRDFGDLCLSGRDIVHPPTSGWDWHSGNRRAQVTAVLTAHGPGGCPILGAQWEQRASARRPQTRWTWPYIGRWSAQMPLP